MMQLAALNINQLVALDALMAERHMGRAASRMGVTQSAMSHTLRSLRELMQDPLLVRVGNTMVLTPYAEEMQVKLRRGLSDLESVVSGRAAFDPSIITDQFTLAAQDGPAAGIAAPLLRELRARAPSARLRIQPMDNDLLHQLSTGDVDLAFASPLTNLDGLSNESLAHTPYSVVCRRDHPVLNKRLSLAQYCQVEHAVLSISGEGPSFVDRLLEQRGRSRRVQVRVPYLLALAEVVASSDLVTSIPEVVAEFLCASWPLKKFRFPLPLDPMPAILAWHPRFDADPARTFFRDVVRDVVLWTARHGKPSFEHTLSLGRATGG